MHTNRNRSISEQLVIAQREVCRIERHLEEYTEEHFKNTGQERRILFLESKLQNSNCKFENLISKTKGKNLVSGRVFMIAQLMKALKPEIADDIDKLMKEEI